MHGLNMACDHTRPFIRGLIVIRSGDFHVLFNSSGFCDSRYYSVILEQTDKGTLDADIRSWISYHEDLHYAANGCVAVFIDERMLYYCTCLASPLLSLGLLFHATSAVLCTL